MEISQMHSLIQADWWPQEQSKELFYCPDVKQLNLNLAIYDAIS